MLRPTSAAGGRRPSTLAISIPETSFSTHEKLYAHKRWRLTFLDDTIEKEFREYHKDRFGENCRKSVNFATGIAVLMYSLDMAMFEPAEDRKATYTRITIPYAIYIVPYLFVAMLPKSVFRRYQEAISVIAILLISAMIPMTIWSWGSDTNSTVLLGFALALNLAAFSFKLLIGVSFYVSMAAIAIYCTILTIITTDFQGVNMVMNIVLLIASNLMLLMAARGMERFIRLEFSSVRTLRLQNARLRVRMLDKKNRHHRHNVLDLESPVEKVISLLEGLKECDMVSTEGTNILDTVLDILAHSENLTAPSVQKQIASKFKRGSSKSAGLDNETSDWLMGEILRTKKVDRPTNESLPPVMVNVPSIALASVEEAIEMPPDFDTWGFDAIAYGEAFEVHKGRPLYSAAVYIFGKMEAQLQQLNVLKERLLRFVMEIEDGYPKENPYHNAIHASDVLQGCWYLLNNMGSQLFEAEHHGSLDVLAVVIAAIVHDFRHPGHTNSFEIATGSDLAIAYNDKSVLENFHISSAWKLLRKDSCNFMLAWPKERIKEFRDLVIDLVLITDISKHFDVVGSFTSRLASGGLNITEKSDRKLILQLMIKLADISNPTRPFPIYEKWAKAITQEFFNQGDKEKKSGIPISAFMDRTKSNLPKSQLGFINFIISPFVEPFVSFSSLTELRANLDSNRDLWTLEAEAVKTNEVPALPLPEHHSQNTLTTSMGSGKTLELE